MRFLAYSGLRKELTYGGSGLLASGIGSLMLKSETSSAQRLILFREPPFEVELVGDVKVGRISWESRPHG
jgi:hypothetical protein